MVGVGAGVGAAGLSEALTIQEFMDGARSYFKTFDVVYGLIKATVFGFVITSVAAYRGFYARGGAEGVGNAATEAAVTGCVYVLLADYLLATTLLS